MITCIRIFQSQTGEMGSVSSSANRGLTVITFWVDLLASPTPRVNAKPCRLCASETMVNDDKFKDTRHLRRVYHVPNVPNPSCSYGAMIAVLTLQNTQSILTFQSLL